MRILLTDGDQRSTLAATRALGSAGHAVCVAASVPRSLATASRHCSQSLVVPSPYADEQGFVRALRAAVADARIDLVIPMADVTSAILSERRETFPPATVAVVDPETFWAASDKNRLHRLAGRLGVPSPVVCYLGGADEIDSLPEVPFPCVVKPSRSRVDIDGRWVRTSVLRAGSPEGLRRLYRERPELKLPSTIQIDVEGEGCGVFALCDRGEPKVMFAHRRLREKPPSGGVSVLRQSVPLEEDVREFASRLLRSLRWHGVAMVEFKRDARHGTAYLMEINGRFWGSLQLAIDAGVNFPLLLVDLYRGRPIPGIDEYRVGIRSRWLLGDVDHVLARLGDRSLRDGGLPPLSSVLLEFCWPFRRHTRFEVESWSDPAPAAFEFAAYARSLLSAAVRSQTIAGRVLRAGRATLSALRNLPDRVVHPLRRRRALAALRRRAPRKILVVCYGNICRSPFAAAALRARLASRSAATISVESGGLFGSDRRAPQPAIEAAARWSVDLERHRSQGITREELDAADLILVMERAHRRALRARFGPARRPYLLLGDLDPAGVKTRDIPDPYNQTPDVFRGCYERIQRCADVVGDLLAPIKVLYLRDTDHICGPGKTILNTCRFIDRRRFDLVVSATIDRPGLSNSFLERVAEEGVRTEPLVLGRYFDPVAIWRLWRLLRTRRIDIVQTADAQTRRVGIPAAYLAGVPHVTSLHGWITNSRWERFVAWTDKLLLRLSRHVIVMSEQMQQLVVGAGLDPSRVTVLRNSIVLGDYMMDGRGEAERDKLGIPTGHKVVATIGRLSAEKGHEVFLNAARLIVEQYPHVTFLVAGRGPLLEHLKHRAASLGLERHVVFAGYVADMTRLYQLTDVVVISSFTEGLPNVLLEAFALQRPVVATHVGGIPEVVSDGANGWLVAPGQAPELADRILRLLEDDALAAAFGRNGRATVERSYRFEDRTRRLEELYARFARRAAVEAQPS